MGQEEHKEPWEMLSDKTIWDMLADADFDLNNDYIRLLIIELFSRVKKLEIENYAAKVITLETGLVSESTYKEVVAGVNEFFEMYDKEKADEAKFYSKSGISFVDWVNFKVYGKFQPPAFEQ